MFSPSRNCRIDIFCQFDEPEDHLRLRNEKESWSENRELCKCSCISFLNVHPHLGGQDEEVQLAQSESGLTHELRIKGMKRSGG